MFSDAAVGAVDVASVWRAERGRRCEEKTTQTGAVSGSDAATQSRRARDAGVQTGDGAGFEGRPPVAPGAVDYSGLLEFLQGVEEPVCRELEKNWKSHAFDGWRVEWAEPTERISCLHSLSYPPARERKLHVTGVSWSSTGAVVACSYGRLDDGDWGADKSYVCAWNLDRRAPDPQRPDLVLDAPSATMGLAFHPRRPSVLAVGLFSGEVLVWDTGRPEDPLIWRSGMTDDSHTDPVYQISRGATLLGVTALSFSPFDPTVFIAGTEGGDVLKCWAGAETPAVGPHLGGGLPLKAPAQLAFAPHGGPVYSVSCSPFHRNLFLSGGTDGHVHLYSMLQAQPLVSLQLSKKYVFGVRWSPIRPLVFAAVTGEGEIHLFDFGQNSQKPSLSVRQSPEPAYCLEFNPRRAQLLAAGDGGGGVKIWQLGGEFGEEGGRERSQLEMLANEVSD
ncbi:cytoplasmic dynein 2 intermediate chain 2 isoform X2 [Podarcis raffonei]|uniref:cytoplasmic dynein 2 intermediate chain 2 isoform X2 n=1 Tax=Podarcis raffonei TaxID=65483 RepID=UPI00232961C3|nr:cytoplasmic dynein 2 intermediate chain 2 isoform X2 [Podarcis raffonei]